MPVRYPFFLVAMIV